MVMYLGLPPPPLCLDIFKHRSLISKVFTLTLQLHLPLAFETQDWGGFPIYSPL